MREELQLRKGKEPQIMKPPSPTIKFGSFNINGLDMETSWAVGELVKKHGFDVIVKRKELVMTYIDFRSWLSARLLAGLTNHLFWIQYRGTRSGTLTAGVVIRVGVA